MPNLSFIPKKAYVIVLAVLILITAGVAVTIYSSNLTRESYVTKEVSKKPADKFKLYGDVTKIDYDNATFTIKQKGTDIEYKVKLPDSTKISIIGTQSQYQFQDIEVGQTLELVSNKPFGSAGGGSGSGGTSGGGSSGGGSGEAGGEEVIIVDDIDEVNVYTPYPGREAIPEVGGE